MNIRFERIEKRTPVLCGAAAVLAGVCGVAGWLLHIPRLIQGAPGFGAMQFNAALGLVLVGAGLALVETRRRIAAACGALAALLGAATFAEYALRIDLHIDSLLYHPWLAAEVPSRMALNATACFMMAGTALALAGLFPRALGKFALSGGVGLLIVSSSAMTGYALGIEIAYRWASQTRMSILAAAAFALVGAGLAMLGWRRLDLDRTLWLTLLTAGGVAGTSVVTWLAVAADYRKMGAPQVVPDLLLFTGISRACLAAIVVFLWRNNRQSLKTAEVLNTDLQGKVAERTAQLDAIFELVTVGTWTHDLITHSVTHQGQHNRIFGLPPEEPERLFRELLEAVHPEDRIKLREAERRASEGDSIDVEFRVIWPDRSEHWVLARGAVSKTVDGKPVCLTGISLDITRLKKVESALQSSEAAVRKLNEALERRIRIQTRELVESERRFRHMVEGLRDYAFFMLDTAGKVVSWNLGAERIHGYRSEEIVGKQFSILCTEEDIARGHPEAQLQLAAEHGQHEESGWRVARDGQRFWAHVLVTAVYDEAGDLCGFSKLVRDITERKRTNEMLEEQRRQAEEANKAKSRFLASMSHEIRTPMNAILGMTDLLWDTDLDEDQRHYVEIFRSAGANLMGLINDILDLSKIESGKLELEKTAFDAQQVVFDVIELLAPKALDKSIGLRARVSPGLATRVVGDPARLRQVLMNLVGNAIKFTSSGEVVAALEAPLDDAPGELVFLVSDTGIGIPQNKLATIFEAFEQVDASTTRKYGGTGLGLPISRKLVECMGGVLRVESEPGRGSTFHFTVKFELAPVSLEENRTGLLDGPAPAESAPLNGVRNAEPAARILVAEDSLDNQFLIQEYLKGAPYTVTFVSDGKAAVKQVRDAVFDAVLMDMQMPVMDGLSATRAIRSPAGS